MTILQIQCESQMNDKTVKNSYQESEKASMEKQNFSEVYNKTQVCFKWG